MKYMLYGLIAVSLLFGTLGLAQTNSSPLELNLERFLVTEQVKDNQKEEVLSKAAELRPGDVIEESLSAANITDTELGAFSLELPVPVGTYYLSESASTLVVAGQSILPQFSFDSGQTYSYPPLLKEVTVVEDGKEVIKEITVPAEEYTHVRWLVSGLNADEQVSTMFRARVR